MKFISMKINFNLSLVVWVALVLAVAGRDYLLANKTPYSAKDEFSLALSEYPFLLDVKPKDATVKIMNIKPKYYEGMILSAGSYDIKVYRSGYHPQRTWINHDGRKHKIELEQESSK